MFDKITHQYTEYCDKEVNWVSADDEHRYLKHLETNWDELNEHGWIHHPQFTYKFNSHGFRSDEFSDEPSVLFLGCSHTIGIGMPAEDTWSRIVAKELNLKCFNLGIGASSNDTAFRLAHHYIPLLKPQLVIWLSTDLSRVELHTADERVEPCGPWTLDRGRFFDHWLINPINSDMLFLKNTLAIEYICKTNNIKLFHERVYNVMKQYDLARDLMHFGKKSNIACANTILEFL